MKKIILTLAIAALTLSLAAQTQAAPKSGGSNKSSPSSKKAITKTSSGSQAKFHQGSSMKNKDYNLHFGTKFDHGFLYKGRNHHHWGLVRFDARYGCDCYWDPCVLVWYYWCDRDYCFYPVSYCPYRSYVVPEVVLETTATSRPLTTGPSQSFTPMSQAEPNGDIPPPPEPLEPRTK